MSSILKALRKVEDENAAMGGGSVDLAHDILKRNYAKPQTNRWPIAVLLGCFGLIMVGAGVWLWSSGSESQPQVIKEQKALLQLPAEVSAVAEGEERSSPLQLGVQRIEALAIESPPAVSEAPVEIPPLRVDEIVYHQDPDARLAVVNDLPVMEGTEIDGVRIEEIFSDGVRCLYQGVQFKIFKSQ